MNTNLLNTSEKRQCIKCKSVKDLNSNYFHRNQNRPHGFEYKCKECAKNRKDRRINRYAEMTVQQKMNHRKANVKYAKTPKGMAIFLISAYRKNDSESGRECTLTQLDVLDVYKKPCTYCGYPSTGFDRKDNSIGHTLENCVPCCKECNVARMDNFTHEETYILGEAIKKIKANRSKNN